MQSSHDALNDGRLSKQVAVTQEELTQKRLEKEKEESKKR
jgi:hypothetical protein